MRLGYNGQDGADVHKTRFVYIKTGQRRGGGTYNRVWTYVHGTVWRHMLTGSEQCTQGGIGAEVKMIGGGHG